MTVGSYLLAAAISVVALVAVAEMASGDAPLRTVLQD